MVPLAALVLLTLTTTVADAEEWAWMTEPFAADCEETDGTKLDQDGNVLDGEHDFVLHKCKSKYGPSMWLLYQDSARISIGFGERPNTVWTGASLERSDWPLEWGGTLSIYRYKPMTVTVRLTNGLGDQTAGSVFFVFKLSGDEPACIVASVNRSEEARQIAVNTNANTTCLVEAEMR